MEQTILPIRQQKQHLRRALSRSALSAEETRLLHERLFSLPECQSAGSVFIYVSVPPEPDTRTLISRLLAAGKRVAVPRMEETSTMSARLIAGLDALKPGRFSIPEPDAEAPILEQPDLCVVPCLACGRDCTRLGHGGGYYDRYLSGRKTFSVCLCPPGALFDRLPSDPHDVSPDVILTPLETLRRV